MKTIKTLCRNFFRLILTGLDALTPDETEAYRPFGLSFEGRAGEKKKERTGQDLLRNFTALYTEKILQASKTAVCRMFP